MAKGDFVVSSNGGRVSLPALVYVTASGSTAINAGEPCVLTTIGSSQYAKVLTDGMPLVDADYLIGIAASTSTHSSTLDGTVTIYPAWQGVWFRGKAKSSTAADTQAEVNALVNKRVVFDLTSSSYTVDTAATDGVLNGLIVVGGDPNNSQIDVTATVRVTPWGYGS